MKKAWRMRAGSRPTLMGRLRVWTTVAGTALLLAAYGASLRAASGGRAPDVDMRDANNVRIHLTDFRGKVVLDRKSVV